MGARVLVKKMEAPKRSKVIEIIVPEGAEEPTQFAMVFAIGNGCPTDEIQVGDTVILKKYSGVPVTVKDEELHMVEYNDVLCRIPKE